MQPWGMQGYGPRFVRVFVVDDHAIVRRGLIDLLTKPDIFVVGDAGSAVEATGRILDTRPDVMLLDVHLQDGTGVQVCRDVRSVDASIKGLLLTAAGDEEALVMAALAGAAGSLVKLAGTADVTDSVRRVAAGRPIRGAAPAERVRELLVARAAALDPALTPRQREVLSLVLDGHTDQQVADQLHSPLAQVRGVVADLMVQLTAPDALIAERGAGRHRGHPE